MDGNLYEFGSFSECFHISKAEKLYQSKYCFGRLTFDMQGIVASKPYQYGIHNMIFGHDTSQTDNELQITPRMAIPP